MCNMTFCELYVALGVGVFAAVDKRNFVVPPTEVAPIRFQVFFELAVHFWVLADTQDNTVSGDTWLVCSTLVPLCFLVMECAHGAGNVNNSPVLGTPVLLNNAGKFSI